MPVVITITPEKVGRLKPSTKTSCSAKELLKAASVAWSPPNAGDRFAFMNKVKEPENCNILQSSFTDVTNYSPIIPYSNGFVNGAITAFQQDLHLVLRPDDVWLAILTQFSMYVNANAETLRKTFVTHVSKKELVFGIPEEVDTIFSIDIGQLAQCMTDLIGQNVIDPDLQKWIMPNFSTTTENDKSVAAVVMMGTLQKYFDYTLRGGCGFPSVTLLGEKSDWEKILQRIPKLPSFGDEPTRWSKLLVPVIEHMISSFDKPNSKSTKDFWLTLVHREGQAGSGDIETLSGWITAFCFWTDESMCLDKSLEYLDRKGIVLDNVQYHIILASSIPQGVVSVPVNVEDLGQKMKYETSMVAGSIGVTVTHNGTKVQPRSGWWMLEDSRKAVGVQL